MQYLSKKYPSGKYTVLDGGNGFVVLMEPYAIALQRLRDAGVDDAERILDAKVPDSEWRAAFIAATASEAVTTREALAQAASEGDVDAVKRVQAKLEAAVAELAAEFTKRGNADDIEKLRAFQEAEFQRLVERHGSGLDSVGEAMFRAHLASTAAGRRLAELEAG